MKPWQADLRMNEATEKTVPLVRDIRDIYPDTVSAAQQGRWQSLLHGFEVLYGQPADFVARSPGRVNLIGEHIDYSLYSVLPMAITTDCLLAVRVCNDEDISGGAVQTERNSFMVQIANVQSDLYPTRTFCLPCDRVEIDATVHEWSNYFKSGLRGAIELLRRKYGADSFTQPRSMQILMDSTVPAGGGLSSSAAFTTTSALAALAANGATAIDKTELTELAIVSERSVGVNSGGMDQSASVFARRGAALLVSFAPTLQAQPVLFPPTQPELCFVIAQTFVVSDKFVTGPVCYNLRVVECTLAAAYLNAVLNPAGTVLPPDASPLGISLRGFEQLFFAHHPVVSNALVLVSGDAQELAHNMTDHMLGLARSTLTQDSYTREQIADQLGLSVDELHAKYMSRFPVRADAFRLRQRALHVFSEACRVLQFARLLRSECAHPTGLHGTTNTEAFGAQLGALMNASQDSCRDLYDCSCPEIDQICSIARRHGSYGSRLTGAGWGGCTVHLVPGDKVDSVQAALYREYYDKRDLTQSQRDAAITMSHPGSGSALMIVDDWA